MANPQNGVLPAPRVPGFALARGGTFANLLLPHQWCNGARFPKAQNGSLYRWERTAPALAGWRGATLGNSAWIYANVSRRLDTL